ncbi:lipocalin family protein [Flavobacterium sp.]|uniref:lipocalin family protein n=1 Tax=Flavobacterium sp. TaxID=239 RepID=UPI00261089C9|nr:lipocalin family protein [Flavobacterium sp.]
MKKKLLVTLTLVAILTGCNKDDEEESSTQSIVGKWRTIKFDYYINGVFDETETTIEENSTCPDYIEFKANGTYVVIENDANCNATADESGTYEYNGTNITTISNGSTEISTVISLTKTDLKIDFTESSGAAEYKSVGYFKKIN